VITAQCHSTEDALEPGEGVVRRGSAPFEHINCVFTADDHGVTSIGRFTRLAEVALKRRQRGLHRNQII
jgi:hypothetical protein